MTQEDRDLVLRDLCARLPYGVKVQGTDYDGDKHDCDLVAYDSDANTFYVRDNEGGIGTLNLNNIKPYLRPMSSMTEEEYKEWSFLCSDGGWGITVDLISDCVNWLLEYHFDFMGLIPMDYAIDCTDLDIY